MGLHNQLTDVAPDSFPILLVATIAAAVRYVRSLLCTVFHNVGPFRLDPGEVDDGLVKAVGSGLAGLVVLAEQLSLNRVLSYRHEGGEGSCMVCLNRLAGGDQVRRLACRHVFHKECFDGWLDHLNFNCPLCRSPVVPDERVALAGRRVTGDLLAWFSLR
ncbi:hypothetical protein RJ639_017123 [Escallonia herrerae]|uniref:RING-type domain-containing protein n=1 Tax=Escallonia herrerae TaxID=1293975 RepID=A0AA88VGN9_9ASTE|nr:hypothetical protein RJ639_017123 [Escallonia herrerae]